jgi:hypothetical protein
MTTELDVDFTVEDMPIEEDNIVHLACPKAFGDMTVTAACGQTQGFPYNVWNNAPDELHCAMCVETYQRQPGFCPKYGACSGGCDG